MSGNYFRLSILTIGIIIYAIDFIPIMVREASRHYNPVRRVSFIILFSLLIGVVTLVPSAVLQFAKIRGWDVEIITRLTDISTYTTTFSFITNLVLLRLVLHYRYKDE